MNAAMMPVTVASALEGIAGHARPLAAEGLARLAQELGLVTESTDGRRVFAELWAHLVEGWPTADADAEGLAAALRRLVRERSDAEPDAEATTASSAQAVPDPALLCQLLASYLAAQTRIPAAPEAAPADGAEAQSAEPVYGPGTREELPGVGAVSLAEATPHAPPPAPHPSESSASRAGPGAGERSSAAPTPATEKRPSATAPVAATEGAGLAGGAAGAAPPDPSPTPTVARPVAKGRASDRPTRDVRSGEARAWPQVGSGSEDHPTSPAGGRTAVGRSAPPASAERREAAGGPEGRSGHTDIHPGGDGRAFRSEAQEAVAGGPVSTFAPARAGETAAALSLTGEPDDVARSLTGEIRSLVLIGREEAFLRLRPPEFGELRVHLSLESGRLAVEMTVESAQVRAILESSLGRLHTALAEQGFQGAALSVQVGSGPPDGRERARERSGAASAQPRSELRTTPVDPRVSGYDGGRAAGAGVDYWI